MEIEIREYRLLNPTDKCRCHKCEAEFDIPHGLYARYAGQNIFDLAQAGYTFPCPNCGMTVTQLHLPNWSPTNVSESAQTQEKAE